ncbi:MAG: hypothetical protein RIG63_16150 [Coleofasciculus chthonoplastes F3-SA18-01]|uniref:hypothetical protein n=1 Tax=Coleofasciculus chthonoplastes TaxID=64178 RepID=UPI0033045715
METKIQGNVLVYARRRYSQFFHEVAQRTFEGNIRYCSDWPSDLSSQNFVNFMPDFYEYYKSRSIVQSLTQEDLKQIITRCRVLRKLPYSKAVRMVNAMYLTLADLIDKYKPDYFFAQSVEHYISDLFCRVCEKSNVTSILIMDGSIEKTILCFKYGEYNHIRNPSDSEINKTLESLLDNSYHLTYGQKGKKYSFFKHFKSFTIWWIKYLIFVVLGFIFRDPLNYRFLLTFLSIEGGGQNSLFNYRFSQFYDKNWKEQLEDAKDPVLYIPLGFTPECSTDYWLKDLRYVDYENFILDLCQSLKNNYVLFVKDHWAMLGKRQSSFYERLKEIPRVVLIPPETNGRAILEFVDRVLIGSGTAGVEAAVRGKRVLSLCIPYYYLEGFYLPLVSANNINDLPSLLEQFSPPELTRENQRRIVKKFLESTLVGSIRVNSELNSEENLQTTSESLKEYLGRSLGKVT